MMIPGRQCSSDTALELAVCTACSVSNCLTCSKDSTHCEKCARGYVSFNGKCIDCDHDASAVFCEECNAAPRQCKRCAEGYRLFLHKCEPCNQAAHCKHCSKSQCQECMSGYWLDKSLEVPECKPCNTVANPHCAECDNGDTCKKCDETIAGLGSDRKCTKCRDDLGWAFNSTSGRCSCPNGFVVATNGNQCKKCDELLDGCKTCKSTAEPADDDKAVHIGYNALTSHEIAKKLRYVMCTKAGEGMVTTVDDKIKSCGEMIPGCEECS